MNPTTTQYGKIATSETERQANRDALQKNLSLISNTPVSTTISANDVGSVRPITVSPPPAPTTAAGLGAEITSLSNSAVEEQDAFAEKARKDAEIAQKNLGTSSGLLSKFLSTRKGETAITDEAYSATNYLGTTVDKTEKKLKDTNAEINAVDISANEQLQRLRETKGMTVSGMADASRAIVRNASFAKADLYIDKLMQQADYDSAKAIADRKVALAMEEDRLQLDALQFDYENNKDLFTKAEQRDFELAQGDRERALNQKQENLQTISDLFIEALKNGAPPAVASQMRGAGSVEEAIKIGGQWLNENTDGGGDSSDSVVVQNYAQLLSEGKISLANVPQGIRNKVVAASNGIINKPLSDVAIKDIQQSQSALANLGALKDIVQKNLQYVGPVSGLARFNPYSNARQVQAEIDRVRQQVGKTLEGGVLRKEDEEKYKKILTTLADTPETAIYKIDSLIGSLERDIEIYKTLQQETGRFVPGANSSTPEDLRAKYEY